MGITAWIVLILAAGPLAKMQVPGRRSHGLMTCVSHVSVALPGGWPAKLFRVATVHGFFNLSTSLTAITGAAILLLACHLVPSGNGGGRQWSHSRAHQ